MLAQGGFRSAGSTTAGAQTPEQAEAQSANVPEKQNRITIGKTLVSSESGPIEVFTMSLGREKISLLPLKTWSQLDTFKWRVQGKLPGTPAGLEIASDYVKVGGENVSVKDPEGCSKLEKAFNDWLALELRQLELAAQKAQSSNEQVSGVPEEEPFHFRVEVDKAGQPHILCLEGNETVANVALTVPGVNRLIAQGFMRKPSSWKVGALRDWIELEGAVYKLRGGKEGFERLENALNEQYLPPAEPGSPPDIMVIANPASSSGFDIQFPALVNGLAETRRRHLDAEAMELLSDPYRCRVLRKGVVVKLTPPNLIFKQKTSDGGERPLEPGPQSTVTVRGDDGLQKAIDLSEPVSHIGLGAAELTTILNHPAINRHAYRSQLRSGE